MRSSFRLPFVKWLAPPFGAAIVFVAGSSVALATTLTAGAVVRVPDNPLGGNPTCAALVAKHTALGSVNYPDAEVEPYIAVDPTNPQHLIGSVQQDRWNDGGANGLTNVVSTDGGATWGLAAGQPQFTICAGAPSGSPGFFDRATDPWVSFSADGQVAYSISDSFNANGPAFGGASSIIISRSTDGGNHWQTPVTARLDTSTQVLNDKESVTGDPLVANNAYAVWDQLVSPERERQPQRLHSQHRVPRPDPVLTHHRQGRDLEPGPGHLRPGPERPDHRQPDRRAHDRARQGGADRRHEPDHQPGRASAPSSAPRRCGKGSTFTAAVIRSTDAGTTWSAAIPIDVQQVPPSNRGAGCALERLPPRVRRQPGQREPLRGLAGRPVQPDRRLQDRLLAVHRRRSDLEPGDSDRPVAGQHAGLPAADPRRLGRDGRSAVLRPGERHRGAAGADRRLHRPLPLGHQRLHEPGQLGRGRSRRG